MSNLMTCFKRILDAFSGWTLPRAGSLVVILACLTGWSACGADEPSVTERTKETVKEATAAVEGAVQDAGRSVSDSFEKVWRSVDQSRLKNRKPDEIVAWVIMGVLVGAVAGMMTSFKPTGLGKLGRLLLGLAGAFLGGIILHLTKVDFGMGPVLIRYEELLFSLAGAIVLIVAARLLRSGAKKKPVAK